MTQHIKFPDTTPIIRYTADGQTSRFEFPFPVFASEDLAVYLNGARQFSGFSVQGAGATEGGSVIFDTAPANGLSVRLERKMPLERLTDFLEGGDFSAEAINTELDFLTAAIQQVSRDHKAMLRYDPSEAPGKLTLPTKVQRAGRVLGFDASGNPVPVSAEGTMAAPDYTPNGAGGITRSLSDRLSDTVSIRDFGAIGDGLTDDTLALQEALAAHESVLIPEGTFLISAPIRLVTQQSLVGKGQSSILKCQNNSFTAIEITEDYCTLSDFRIEGGAIGIRLFGVGRPCVQNAITNIHIIAPVKGIELDGYTDLSKPCYWNNFTRVLIEQPAGHGVHLTRSGAGDTPNANKFHDVRIQSKSAPISGSGFFIEHGAFNNSLIDCEANVDGTADACFRLGPYTNKTLLINPYAESFNLVPNIRIDNGSQNTSIYNLLSASNGAAIWDFSGGNFDAYNSGFPEKNRLQRSVITDLKATLMRFDTEFIDTPGLTNVDLSHSQHIVNALNGAIEMRLPAAGDAVGVSVTIKKTDSSSNIVSITEDGGPGPDRQKLDLGGQYDYATILSNGAEWFITASNRMAGNTRFFDGSGIYDIDMAVDIYLLSSATGTLEARLPPANAAEAIGRVITIKKTDTSSNTVTVTEQGAVGPDNYEQPLNNRYDAITVVSNGGQWYVISKNP